MPDSSDGPPDDLPDDAVVVRGGLMLPAGLALSVQSHFDTEGVYALSVFSVPGKTADEIVSGVFLPHSTLRESTVGRLRAAGYDVVSSPGPPGHADLILPNSPTDDDWQALDETFDAPRPKEATMGGDDV